MHHKLLEMVTEPHKLILELRRQNVLESIRRPGSVSQQEMPNPNPSPLKSPNGYATPVARKFPRLVILLEAQRGCGKSAGFHAEVSYLSGTLQPQTTRKQRKGALSEIAKQKRCAQHVASAHSAGSLAIALCLLWAPNSVCPVPHKSEQRALHGIPPSIFQVGFHPRCQLLSPLGTGSERLPMA